MNNLSAIIISHTGHLANWGCQATSNTLVSKIHTLLQKTFPNKTTSLDILPSIKKTLVVKLLGKLLNNFLASCYIEKRNDFIARQILSIACKIIYQQDFAKVLKADIVFFQAEGIMTGNRFHQLTGLFLLPYFAKVILGKPVVSLNQTLFSTDEASKEIICHCYNLFDVVAVREMASLIFAQEIGIENAFLLPDTAFNTAASGKINDSTLDYEHQKYFCISGSEGISQNHLQHYTDIATYYIQQHDLHVIFLLSAPIDVRQLQPYVENWKASDKQLSSHIHILPNDTSLNDVVGILNNSTFLVGGRYHMALLAFNVGTPFILFPSRTHKSEGLLTTLDYPIPLCNPEDVSEIKQYVDLILSDPIEMESRIKKSRTIIQDLTQQGESILLTKLATLAKNL